MVIQGSWENFELAPLLLFINVRIMYNHKHLYNETISCGLEEVITKEEAEIYYLLFFNQWLLCWRVKMLQFYMLCVVVKFIQHSTL